MSLPEPRAGSSGRCGKSGNASMTSASAWSMSDPGRDPIPVAEAINNSLLSHHRAQLFTRSSPRFRRMSIHFVEASRVRLALRAGTAAAVAAVSLAYAVGPATGSSSAPATRTQGVTLANGRIGHVFVVVLENEDYSASYVNNKNPWLGHKLQQQGTLLTKYYGTGHNSLGNYVSMISGQAPDPETSADCQQYHDFQPVPAPIGAGGQAMGNGCVYPANVLTLGDQLTKKSVSWRGYMEDMGNTPGRESKPCGQPGDPSGEGGTGD